MIYDAHLHQYHGPSDTPREFLEKAKSAGVIGGSIFSIGPTPSYGNPDYDFRWEYRLEKVLEFTAETPGFIPYLRMDAMAPDAEKQIHTAVEKGIKGVKIICERYYPCDIIRTCEIIAEAGLPLMFHSGILAGDRKLLSGRFNKPLEFECLFNVPKLRFSLAHIGWPWVEDYMAMVSKSFFVTDPEFGNELFFDITPGTPGINREDALRKLYLSCYDVRKKVLWGTDGAVNDYAPKLPRFWIERDSQYMKRIGEDSYLGDSAYRTHDLDYSNIFAQATEENWKIFNRITD